MKKSVFSVLFFVACFLFLVVPSVFAASPRLYFDTTEVGVKENQEFDLVMKIDTDSAAVSGADVVLMYNPQMIEIIKIDNGNFFPLFGKHYEINNQKIYITGFFTEKNETKTGAGVFAKLNLKALKNGATSLTFTCTPQSLSDTNIIDVKGSDLINCSTLAPLQIKVSATSYQVLSANKSSFGRILGTESGVLVTTYPTATPTTSTSTTSGMMETGVFDSAAFMIAIGAIFILFGGVLLFYCRQNLVYSYRAKIVDPRLVPFHSLLE